MPRQITEMPDPKPRGNRKYDWESWVKPGPENRLAFVEGEDFDCKPSSFEVQVRSEASTRGFKASVLEDEPTEDGRTVLAVEFSPKPADESTEDESEATDES